MRAVMQNPPISPRPRTSVWTDPQVRGWLFQIIAVIAVVAIGWYLFHNTQHNLAQRGILSGFGFLEQSAGFGISQHLIDYTESDSYGRVFVIGLPRKRGHTDARPVRPPPAARPPKPHDATCKPHHTSSRRAVSAWVVTTRSTALMIGRPTATAV